MILSAESRSKVLHIADRNRGIRAVAHDFVLDLFKSFNTFFNKDLPNWRQSERVLHNRDEFFFVIRESAAGSAKRKGGPQHDRIADLFGDSQSFFNRFRHVRREDGLVDLLT